MHCGVPVISVGNITVGGTGKTPVVIKLIEKFSAQYTVGIVTRGYRRRKNDILIVDPDSNAEHPVPSIHAIGDEPMMMVSRFPNITLGIGHNRQHVLSLLMKQCTPDLVILDDGFHRHDIHRDCNILLIDATHPFGNAHLFPRGILREPLKSIARADVILVTKTNYSSHDVVTSLVTRLRTTYHKPVFTATYETRGIQLLGTPTLLPVDTLQNKHCVLASGIAHACTFVHTVEALGVTLTDVKEYNDHHWYTENDVRALCALAQKSDGIITTEKDAVKLAQFLKLFGSIPVYVVIMDMVFDVEAAVGKLKITKRKLYGTPCSI